MISFPAASIASIIQDLYGVLPTITVHAPQSPFSQPGLTPVSPSRVRRTSSNVSAGRISVMQSSPFMWSVNSF